jgi:predicted MPP superfamily phosphohydrolase
MTQNSNARLTGAQEKQLADGLLAAFTGFDDLARVVRVALDESLNRIVDQRADFKAQVWQLVEWVDAKGKVRDLFLAAVREVPGNAQLRAATAGVLGQGVLDDRTPPGPDTPAPQRPARPSTGENVIKVLFLAANPSGTTHLALDEEVRAIDAKIRGAEHRDRLTLLSHWAVRLDDLSGILLRHQPQIVHFSGHGSKSGSITLVGSNGQAWDVPPEALAGLFRVLKDNVRVVVFNACYAAAQAKAIVKEIDCAVGMSDAILDTHAIAFAAEFYQALAWGRSVQEAFDLGVVRLVGEGVADAKRLVKLHKRKGVKPAEIVLIGDGLDRASATSGPASSQAKEIPRIAPVRGEQMNTHFGWLHLTDLHFGMSGQKWLWPNIREEFFRDLEKLHRKSGPWDLVLFTGDFVQKGGADEFEKLNEMLDGLWEHLRKLGSDPVLVGVPGNHDLVRPKAADPVVAALRTGWGDMHVQREFWTKPKSAYRKAIQKAFKNYTTWWAAHTLPRLDSHRPGLLPGDFSATIEKGGRKLGVVGLNTTFLQLEGGDYKGKLAVSPQQFHQACGNDGVSWVREHDLCILLTHQPPDWLRPESQQNLYGEIAVPGRFAVHLFGHMHESATRTLAQGGADARREWQGCSLFGLEEWGEAAKELRLHGYSAGRVELTDATCFIRIWPRKAEPHQAGHRHIVPDPSHTLEEDEGTRPEPLSVAPRKATDIVFVGGPPGPPR